MKYRIKDSLSVVNEYKAEVCYTDNKKDITMKYRIKDSLSVVNEYKNEIENSPEFKQMQEEVSIAINVLKQINTLAKQIPELIGTNNSGQAQRVYNDLVDSFYDYNQSLISSFENDGISQQQIEILNNYYYDNYLIYTRVLQNIGSEYHSLVSWSNWIESTSREVLEVVQKAGFKSINRSRKQLRRRRRKNYK